MKEQKEESIYCAMEAKQLWLYFSIVLHGNQLDEGIITYQARGILSAFPWEMFWIFISFGIFISFRGKKSLQLNIRWCNYHRQEFCKGSEK